MLRRGGVRAGVSPVASTLESAAGPAAMAASDSLVLARRLALVTHVEQARAGDRFAFEALVEQRIHQTFRTACAILGNEADGHDATQESFIQVWRNLPRLRDPASFDAWFGRIIVNACRQVLRGRRRRSLREIPTTDLFDPLEGVETRDPAPDEQAASSDALERAFERLSIDQRSILVRHHLEHQALAEIASDLGIPTGTAKSRLHAARQALERALEVEQR
jgi:RNA polymerase sigma-70 factor (ECF subfamily)